MNIEVRLAAKEGSLEKVKRLLSTDMVGVNCRVGEWLQDKGERLTTPLNVAVREGHTNVAHLLLEEGADPNIANIRAMTPLMYATMCGHIDITQALLNNGADPNKAENIHGSRTTGAAVVRAWVHCITFWCIVLQQRHYSPKTPWRKARPLQGRQTWENTTLPLRSRSSLNLIANVIKAHRKVLRTKYDVHKIFCTPFSSENHL